MRHLFVINPKAFFLRGRINDVCTEIRTFFANYPQIEYDIHVTRWRRDAMGFARRYVSTVDKMVRVYAVGGMGTLMEVINGVVGMPNVQVAAWPFGIDNAFLHYFGEEKMEHFYSLRNLVFSGVSSFDLIRCGNNYGICAGFMGAPALAARKGDRIMENMDYVPGWLERSSGIYLVLAAYYATRKQTVQPYQVVLDGMPLNGDYISILIANQPHLTRSLCPAPEAQPDDGLLDIYLVQAVAGPKLIGLAVDYAQGRYHKWPHYISHFRGKTLAVSSDKIMHICIDGEHFYDAAVEYEVVPQALDFVCPGGHDGQRRPA
ncbi:MAG: hypothetical protein LBQ46_06310 [Treponema sp.]|jgi:diacylglycerol kinase family enzyme|nr:hypothetical protein [Treponema sp.]